MVTSGSMLPLSVVTGVVDFLLFVVELKKLSMLDCCPGSGRFLESPDAITEFDSFLKKHDKAFLTWWYYCIKGATNSFFRKCFKNCFEKCRWEGALRDETVFAIKINVFITEKDHA